MIPFTKRLSYKQTKNVFIIALFLGIISSISQIYVDFVYEKFYFEKTVTHILETTENPATQAAYTLDQELANQVVRGIFAYEPIYKVVLRNDRGAILASYQRPLYNSQWRWLAEISFGVVHHRRITLTRQEKYTSQAIEMTNAVGSLEIHLDTTTLVESFFQRAWILIFAGLARDFLLAFILLLFFHYTVTQPLSTISKNLINIKERPEKTRLPVVRWHKDDELGILIQTVNQLLTAVDEHIAEKEQREEFLRKLSRAVEQSPVLIIITDVYGKIEYVNPSFYRLSEYSAEEVIGKKPSLLKSGYTLKSQYENLWQKLLEGKEWRGEFLNKKKYGGFYWVNAHISGVRDKNGNITHFLAIEEDISEIKVQEKQLQDLIYYDTLTHLPNRNLFDDRLEMMLQQAKRTGKLGSVILLDIDRFKGVNDSLGYVVGDALLREIAKRLVNHLNKGEVLSRISGDEFALLLPNVKSVEKLAKTAESILNSFKQPFTHKQQEFFFTASLGISLFPNDGDDADTVLRNAEVAMYRVKTAGRNGYQFYTPAMNVKATESLSLENSLRRAVADKDIMSEQFLVYYQPQIDLKTENLIGLEALIRWQHPQEGLISPGKFIPLAEETGLIVPLGEWILWTACQQNKLWQQQGYSAIRVAVNLSAKQFHTLGLVELVAKILQETDLAPQYLDLEMTESTLMNDAYDVCETLTQLKKLGVHISIDDFGTGHSSLNYLRKFSVDTLKIDQSFIRDLNVDEDDAILTKVIIDMSHNLHLKVIAEGVENAQQLTFLRHHGCDEVQGFFISKPLPAQEIENFLQK